MKRNNQDPLDAFLNSTLNQEGYTPFYCPDHGKQLVKQNIIIEVNGVVQDWPAPLCSICSREMSNEDHIERRKRRRRILAMLRKNLEGDQ